MQDYFLKINIRFSLMAFPKMSNDKTHVWENLLIFIKGQNECLSHHQGNLRENVSDNIFKVRPDPNINWQQRLVDGKGRHANHPERWWIDRNVTSNQVGLKPFLFSLFSLSLHPACLVTSQLVHILRLTSTVCMEDLQPTTWTLDTTGSPSPPV